MDVVLENVLQDKHLRMYTLRREPQQPLYLNHFQSLVQMMYENDSITTTPNKLW